MRIDAHQHFWHFDPIRDAWIDESMERIRKDFLPKDLKPILENNHLDGCVSVQASQSESETEFLLKLAHENEIIKGVVGWVDLLSDGLAERLAFYCKDPFFKGVRHIAQAEPDDYFLRRDVQKGISMLGEFDLTYDILVFAHQLPSALEMVRKLPDQSFVLDHIAKPRISEGLNDEWITNIKELASFENVACKLSGMVTETKDFQWSKDDFRTFIDVIINEFGASRVMYGSDWPVCLLAATYAEQLAIIEDSISGLSQEDKAKIMGGNARDFYKLNLEV